MFTCFTKPTLSSCKPLERFIKIIFGKFWPEFFRKPKFGVGSLPQDEVGNALLSPCSDHQVNRSRPRHTHITINVFDRQFKSFGSNVMRSLRDIPTTAIVCLLYTSDAADEL